MKTCNNKICQKNNIQRKSSATILMRRKQNQVIPSQKMQIKTTNLFPLPQTNKVQSYSIIIKTYCLVYHFMQNIIVDNLLYINLGQKIKIKSLGIFTTQKLCEQQFIEIRVTLFRKTAIKGCLSSNFNHFEPTQSTTFVVNLANHFIQQKQILLAHTQQCCSLKMILFNCPLYAYEDIYDSAVGKMKLLKLSNNTKSNIKQSKQQKQNEHLLAQIRKGVKKQRYDSYILKKQLNNVLKQLKQENQQSNQQKSQQMKQQVNQQGKHRVEQMKNQQTNFNQFQQQPLNKINKNDQQQSQSKQSLIKLPEHFINKKSSQSTKEIYTNEILFFKYLAFYQRYHTSSQMLKRQLQNINFDKIATIRAFIDAFQKDKLIMTVLEERQLINIGKKYKRYVIDSTNNSSSQSYFFNTNYYKQQISPSFSSILTNFSSVSNAISDTILNTIPNTILNTIPSSISNITNPVPQTTPNTVQFLLQNYSLISKKRIKQKLKLFEKDKCIERFTMNSSNKLKDGDYQNYSMWENVLQCPFQCDLQNNRQKNNKSTNNLNEKIKWWLPDMISYPLIFRDFYWIGKQSQSIKKANNQDKYKSDHVILSNKKQRKKKKYYILAHGFQGLPIDLSYLINMVRLANQKIKIIVLKSYKNNMEQSIQIMALKVADEIKSIFEKIDFREIQPQITFIGHSMGPIIFRAALKNLVSFAQYFDTFVSICSPHLGYIQGTKFLTQTGLSILSKLKPIQSLNQLSNRDNSSLEKTFIYRLSTQGSLGCFKRLILIGSLDDDYVPWHSARIQPYGNGKGSLSDKQKIQRQMIINIFGGSSNSQLNSKRRLQKVQRIEISFPPDKQKRSLNSFIGRTCHIKPLSDRGFLQILTREILGQSSCSQFK